MSVGDKKIFLHLLSLLIDYKHKYTKGQMDA